MRDLTEEELKLAPEWATHYNLFDEARGRVLFSCHERFVILDSDGGVFEKGSIEEGYNPCLDDSDAPILKFDISEHEFSDAEIECVPAEGNKLLLVNYSGDNSALLDKPDAIAIAKALGVTGEDLL
jgi:hypothetical protein